MITATFRHEPGVLLQTAARSGISGVARVTVHEGLSLQPAGAQTVLVSIPKAQTFWCAYYGAGVLQNRWQPFDQPTVAAYMPLPFNELDTVPVGDAGALLLQHHFRPDCFQGTVVSDGEERTCDFLPLDHSKPLEERLRSFLVRAGVPCDRVEGCLSAILERTDKMRPTL